MSITAKKSSEENATFQVTTTKIIKDVNEENVEVIDKTEYLSLADLESQKANWQARIDVIQEKIDAIEAL